MSGAEEGGRHPQALKWEGFRPELELDSTMVAPTAPAQRVEAQRYREPSEDKDSDSMEDTAITRSTMRSQVHDRFGGGGGRGGGASAAGAAQAGHRDQDSSDDERAPGRLGVLRASALPRPRWQALPALRSRSWV